MEKRKPSHHEEGEAVLRPHAAAGIDAEEEKKLIRKLDITVCPVLFCIYLLSFLDRANIGNARIQGMDEDLELDKENRYNIVLMVFFVSYILFELPSNIILKHSRPSIYIPALVFGWALVALRFLLGVFESGLYPGILYILSTYYRRFEIQRRLCAIWSASLLAGSFSGLLAYAISGLDGRAGYRAWRWIFIIEGAFTAVFGLAAVFLVPDWPRTNRFLNDLEKHLVQLRLDQDGKQEVVKLTRASFMMIVGDWKIWLGRLMMLGTIITGYVMNFFLPSILQEFGWEAEAAQVHTIPVYAVTFAVAVACSWASDRLRHRFLFILALCEVKYAATFLVEMGYVTAPIAITWIVNNFSGPWKRSIESAIVNSVGSCGGIIASNIFLEREKPRYATGFGVSLAAIWMSALCAVVFAAGVVRENQMRERRGEREEEEDGREDDLANMGDYHPSFRYTL
ncbi:major facilitator superfamily domain-containing protein [Xylariomycetidae sp. FL2044]|nr:major facilitator superfamily domain-containing protein [Xylariomycetidae sp. FL2044]